jgi:hypothetical protein
VDVTFFLITEHVLAEVEVIGDKNAMFCGSQRQDLLIGCARKPFADPRDILPVRTEPRDDGPVHVLVRKQFQAAPALRKTVSSDASDSAA